MNAGWYTNPRDPQQVSYFDGYRWGPAKNIDELDEGARQSILGVRPPEPSESTPSGQFGPSPMPAGVPGQKGKVPAIAWIFGAAGLVVGAALALGGIGASNAISSTQVSPSPTPTTDDSLSKAVDSCGTSGKSGTTLGDGGQSLSIRSKESSDSTATSITDVACMLKAINTPDYVIDRIDRTRALDGTQSDTWKDYSASWTYHPDNGLNIIIHIKSN